jgi:class 3 adenylate cyclase
MKIKTIGDSYMAVAFPSAQYLQDIVHAAHTMLSHTFTWPHNHELVLFRIGIHVGSVVAGVLGTERMQYDVWGDTVNVASRMESTGEAGRIHVSEAFALLLSPGTSHLRERGGDTQFPIPYSLFPRGEIEIKGKGTMTTYWLESPLP